MARTYKILDAAKGVFEETETKEKVQEFTLDHIRNMISQREQRKAEFNNEIVADINIWKDRESAIIGLPGFKELEPTPE